MAPSTAATNDGRQSTHRHADEQLLVGWMAGAPESYDNNNDNNNDNDAKLQHQQGQTTTPNAMAPTPTPTSNCS
jgi:hypothetical protein